jgi:hypothetical protein
MARASVRTKSGVGDRKKALRNAPNWLTELDLDDPTPAPVRKRSPRAPRAARNETRPAPKWSGVIEKNKAEEWAENLPDLAIWERRRELDARKYEPTRPRAAASEAPVSESPAVRQSPNIGPYRRRAVNPVREAARNATILALGALGIGLALTRIPRKGK